MHAYHELILSGSHAEVRAFLAGMYADAGWPWDVRYHHALGVREESLGRKLLEDLHLRRDLSYLIVPSARVGTIRAACARARQETGVELELHAAHPIEAASFEYRFEIYQRELAQRVRTLLGALPESVRLEGAEVAEEERPAERGVEVYTPVHDYVCKGRGRARGPLDEILALRDRLKAIEPVVIEPIALETGGD